MYKNNHFSSSSASESSPQEMSAECPLFFQPGKPGFYSLRAGVNTPGRLNAFRNVGRILGLCMLFSEVLPIPLCRHVYKYLLHREVCSNAVYCVREGHLCALLSPKHGGGDNRSAGMILLSLTL